MEQITNLEEADAAFLARGATHYHESEFPGVADPSLGRIFARHYFNRDGEEIGYVLPYMIRYGSGVHTFDPPRVWGFYKTLIPLA